MLFIDKEIKYRIINMNEILYQETEVKGKIGMCMFVYRVLGRVEYIIVKF